MSFLHPQHRGASTVISPPTADPVEFVRAALGPLPTNPVEVSVDDLLTLTAVAQGLSRRALDANDGMARLLADGDGALDELVARGVFTEACDGRLCVDRQHLAREVAWSVALIDRHTDALEVLGAYLNPALAAHGFNLDAHKEAHR